MMFTCLDKELKGLEVYSPSGDKFCERLEDAFVDDTLMTVGGDGRDSVEELRKNSQVHERYLYATGGMLALNKCFWTLVEWVWKDGSAEIEDYDSRTVTAENEDKRMRIILSQDGTEAVVKRIGPHKEYRTLGAFISSSGSFTTQVKVLTRKTRDWVYKIKYSALSECDKLLAYNAFLLPQVLYTTPCLQLDHATLQRIHRPAQEIALNAMGMNRSYPRAVAYAGAEYFGLDLKDYSASQGVAQLDT